MRVVLRKLPFLFVGPIGPLTTKALTWLAEEAIQEGEMRVFFLYVDFRADLQAKDFEAAMIHNYNMQMVGDEDDKKIAEARLANALDNIAVLRK